VRRSGLDRSLQNSLAFRLLMKAKDSMLERVGEAEAPEHDARRQVEALRELLVLIRDHVDLPDDIVAKIDAILGG
jgi:hypothetical protein